MRTGSRPLGCALPHDTRGRSVSDPTRRPARADSNPSTAGSAGSRAGRRERPRASYRRESFVGRHRTQLLVAGSVVVAALVIGFLYVGATQKAYACSNLVDPVTAAAAPSGSPRLGQQEKDMGNSHVAVGTVQRYTYCPPASGNHFNATGRGPIAARYYPPDEGTEPQGWVHNLEHGALVVLYNCSGGCPDDATLQKLKSFVSSFPQVRRARVGSPAHARHVGHGPVPRVLRERGRTEQPGEAMRSTVIVR